MIRVRTLVKSLKATPPPPLMLLPIHLRLLLRGARFRWIGFADDAGTHHCEIAALGELERAGLVEEAKDYVPAGPPMFPPCQITQAGLDALRSQC